jgi:hypothetical protein
MTNVKVLYKFVDGAHFFVSNDEASVGLCVAHNDLETAFNSVEIQLEKLFKKNHGVEVKFSPSMSAMAFAAWTKHQQNENSSMPSPGIAGMVPWMKNEIKIAA